VLVWATHGAMSAIVQKKAVRILLLYDTGYSSREIRGSVQFSLQTYWRLGERFKLL
jgi:hypothetical protein